MPSPDFLVFGAQKSGSTWLARNISQHPDVFVFDHEVHFFDKRHNFAKGREWYEAHFELAGNARMIGEKTPDYLWANGQGAEGHLPEVHRNIYEYYPDIKLIAVLRNPVDRAVSAINHNIRSGRVSPLHSVNSLLVGKKRHLVRGYGVIEKGLYFRQIQAYLEVFRREQFLFLIFEEDVLEHPQDCLARACRFLGIDDSLQFANLQQAHNVFNRSIAGLLARRYLPFGSRIGRRLDRWLPHTKKAPSKRTIASLYEIYAEENEKLFDLLGRRPASWLKNPSDTFRNQSARL